MNDCATYATARTSILVYKGKGILVKRSLSRDDAIIDAITEFDISADARQVYLTSFVGAQGQEVEISRSAFAFVRDTIPIHVHLKEEDDGAERARWPALPMAGLVPEAPKVEPNPPAPAPPRFPYLFGLVGGEGSKTTESKIESKIESISDWQRHASGTPDTSASVHRPRLDNPPAATQRQDAILPNQEELLSEGAMNSLVNKYGTNGTSLSSALPDNPGPNNAGKAWNWFKRAGTAMKANAEVQVKDGGGITVEHSASRAQLPSDKISDGKTASELDIHHLPKRPSKFDMQTHRHNTSRCHEVENLKDEQLTEEIETLLQDRQTPPSVLAVEQGCSVHVAKHMSKTTLPDATSPWGPGALVLDDGISESSVSIDAPNDTRRPPWWAKPVDAFDEKNRRKLGLKPLHLSNNDCSESETTHSDIGSRREHARAGSKPGRPPPITTNKAGARPAQSGKISPGAPRHGERRRKNSRTILGERDERGARPPPDDIPESPFSSRRFTRQDVRLDMGRVGHRPTQSKALYPRDAVPEENFPHHLGTDEARRSRVPAPAVPKAKLPAAVQVKRLDASSSRSTTTHRGEHDDVFYEGSQVRGPDGTTHNTQNSDALYSRQGMDALSRPKVPVASRPPARPLPASRSSSQQSGTFAAAAMAARRQVARDGSNLGNRTAVKQRTSLSSLQDFVAAELPGEDKGNQGIEEPQDDDEEGTVVNLNRLVLGPMDLSSPNRKGSTLVMKAKLGTSKLSLEWQPESRVVLSVPFDVIKSLQLPDPECSESFLVIHVTTGEVRTILVELDKDNLLLFQRFVMVFIMGLGAEMDLLSRGGFQKLSDASGW